MFANMAGQIAESNGLNFSEETHGYPWGKHELNKLKFFCFNSIFEISRATPGTSASF